MARVTRAAFDQLPLLYDPKTMTLEQSGLQVGDILIHNDSHVWAAYKDSGPLASFHTSMIVTATDRCHATPGGNGVTQDFIGTMGDMAIVFRLAPALLHPFAGQAAGYAIGMVGVAYSKGRAVASALVDKSFGKSARKRLAKYGGANYNYRPKHVICSEMIILAYQFALGEGHNAFIDLDAKHATPGDLESYFLKHPNIWDLAGRVKGVKVH